jgi:hypothetical protein
MNATWYNAWACALDELDADVARIEALLADDHRVRDLPPLDPWMPPDGLGPLPLDLRPRADAVLARQLAAAQMISRALVTNRRQAAAAARLSASDEPYRPRYVDIRG